METILRRIAEFLKIECITGSGFYQERTDWAPISSWRSNALQTLTTATNTNRLRLLAGELTVQSVPGGCEDSLSSALTPFSTSA